MNRNKSGTRLTKFLSKLMITFIALLTIAPIGASALYGGLSLMTPTITASAKTHNDDSKSNKTSHKPNKHHKPSKTPKGSKKESNTTDAGDSSDSSGKDPMETVVDKIAKGEQDEYTDKSFMGHLKTGLSRFGNAAKMIASLGHSGDQGISKMSQTMGVTPMSPAGNQWSAMAGGNGLFGLADKNTYDTQYSNLNQGKEKQEGKAAEYGLMLSEMGLDHSNEDGMIKDTLRMFGRWIGGGLLYIGVFINSADYWLFKIVIWMFNEVNPLAIVTRHGSAKIIAPIAGIMRDWWHSAEIFGLIVAFFSLVFSFAAAYMNKRVPTSGWLHPVAIWAKRIFFITVIPALMMAVFSFSFHMLGSVFSQDSDSTTVYAVDSTLVNFKDWVEHSRLELPKRMQGKIPYGQNKPAPPATHQFALAVNGEGAGLVTAEQTNLKATGDDYQGHNHAAALGDKKTTKEQSRFGMDDSTLNIINNWFSGTNYSAADYESFVKSHLSQGDFQKANDDHFKVILEQKKDKSPSSDCSSAPWPFANNGTLKVENGKYYTKPAPSTGTISTYNNRQDKVGNASNAKLDSDADGGLSTLGMFNYLETVFSDTGISWTSSSSLSNSISAPEHKVVGMTGRGLNTLGNFVLMIALMYSIGIFGFCLILYDINATWRSVPSLFVNGLLNEAGSVGKIEQGKVHGAGVTLVLDCFSIVADFIGTSIIYVVGRQLLIGVSEIPDQIFGPSAYNTSTSYITNMLQGVGLNVSEAGGYSSFLYSLSCFFMGFLLMWLTGTLLKYWHQLKQALDEMITNVMKQVGARLSNRSTANAQGGNSYSNTNPETSTQINPNSHVNALSNNNNNTSNNAGNPGNGSFGVNPASNLNGKSGKSPHLPGTGSQGLLGNHRGNSIADAGKQNQGRFAAPETYNNSHANNHANDNNANNGADSIPSETGQNALNNALQGAPQMFGGTSSARKGGSITGAKDGAGNTYDMKGLNGNSPMIRENGGAFTPFSFNKGEHPYVNRSGVHGAPRGVGQHINHMMANHPLSQMGHNLASAYRANQATMPFMSNRMGNNGSPTRNSHASNIMNGKHNAMSSPRSLHGHNGEMNSVNNSNRLNDQPNQFDDVADEGLSRLLSLNGGSALNEGDAAKYGDVADQLASQSQMPGANDATGANGVNSGSKNSLGNNSMSSALQSPHHSAMNSKNNMLRHGNRFGGARVGNKHGGAIHNMKNNGMIKIGNHHHGLLKNANQLHNKRNGKQVGRNIQKAPNSLKRASQSAGVRIPLNTRQANSNVKAAMGAKQRANMASSQIHAMPNASPARKHAVNLQMGNATSHLRNARLGAAALNQSKPVGQNMLQRGVMNRPSRGQARLALRNVFSAQNNLVNAGNHHASHKIMSSAGAQLNSAMHNASQLGLSPKTFNTRAHTQGSISHLNRGISRAIQGQAPINTHGGKSVGRSATNIPTDITRRFPHKMPK